MIHEVFLDMDMVLADFISAIEKHFDKQLPDKFGYDLTTYLDRSWDVIKWDLDTTFWQCVPLMPWAKKLVKWLVTEFKSVYVVTKQEPIAGYMEGKLLWLSHWFPELVPNLIIMNEKHLLANPERLLVDDLPANVRAWVLNHGCAVEVPARWKNDRSVVEQFDIFDAIETEIRMSYNV